MWKKILLATVAAFVATFLLDWLIHGVLLSSTYEQYKVLFRPKPEMKMWVIWVTELISLFCFTFIYSKYFSTKNMKNAIMYGLLWGIASGLGMGYGSFAMFPLPYVLAISWFWGCVVEMTVCGIVISFIIKD